MSEDYEAVDKFIQDNCDHANTYADYDRGSVFCARCDIDIVKDLRAKLEAVEKELSGVRKANDSLIWQNKKMSNMNDYLMDINHQELMLTKQRDQLQAANGELIKALDKLARLGNEPNFGNSIGNTIAIEALQSTPDYERVKRLEEVYQTANEIKIAREHNDHCAELRAIDMVLNALARVDGDSHA